MSRLLKFFAVIFFLLIAGAGGLYFFFPVNHATERLIISNLQQRGATHAALKVDSIGTDHISLSNITLSEGISAAKAHIAFDPHEVRDGRVRDVEIEGLRLKIVQTGDTYSFGGMGDFLKDDKTTAEKSAFAWPLGQLRLKDTEVTLLREKQEPMVFTLADATISPDKSGTLRLSGTTLKHVAPAPYFIPLDITLQITPAENLRISGTLRDKKKLFTLAGKGNYNTAKHSGTAQVSITPVTFVEGTLEPKTLLPFLADKLPATSGTVRGEGEWRWDAKNNHGKLTLFFENVALQNALSLMLKEGVTAEGLISGRLPIIFDNGTVTVDNASFAAPAGGRIVYKPTANSVLDANMQTDIVKQALQNFHFKTFSLVAHNESPGMMLLKMDLTGNNPELYDGKPIELHVQLRGDFVGIIKSSMGVYTMQQSIEEKLNEKK